MNKIKTLIGFGFENAKEFGYNFDLDARFVSMADAPGVAGVLRQFVNLQTFVFSDPEGLLHKAEREGSGAAANVFYKALRDAVERNMPSKEEVDRAFGWAMPKIMEFGRREVELASIGERTYAEGMKEMLRETGDLHEIAMLKYPDCFTLLASVSRTPVGKTVAFWNNTSDAETMKRMGFSFRPAVLYNPKLPEDYLSFVFSEEIVHLGQLARGETYDDVIGTMVGVAGFLRYTNNCDLVKRILESRMPEYVKGLLDDTPLWQKLVLVPYAVGTWIALRALRGTDPIGETKGMMGQLRERSHLVNKVIIADDVRRIEAVPWYDIEDIGTDWAREFLRSDTYRICSDTMQNGKKELKVRV